MKGGGEYLQDFLRLMDGQDFATITLDQWLRLTFINTLLNSRILIFSLQPSLTSSLMSLIMSSLLRIKYLSKDEIILHKCLTKFQNSLTFSTLFLTPSLMSMLTSSFLMSLLMSSFLKIKYYKLKGLVSLKINFTIFKNKLTV